MRCVSRYSAHLVVPFGICAVRPTSDDYKVIIGRSHLSLQLDPVFRTLRSYRTRAVWASDARLEIKQWYSTTMEAESLRSGTVVLSFEANGGSSQISVVGCHSSCGQISQTNAAQGLWRLPFLHEWSEVWILRIAFILRCAPGSRPVVTNPSSFFLVLESFWPTGHMPYTKNCLRLRVVLVC